MPSAIPTLDIALFDTDRAAFVAELGAAYREWGFAGIRNHGIPQPAIDAAYGAFRDFFPLPVETKLKYHVPGSGGARERTEGQRSHALRGAVTLPNSPRRH